MKKEKITWNKVEQLCKNIETQLRLTKFVPDGIIAISRGGSIPGIILSHRLGCNIATMAVRGYKGTESLDKLECNWHIATNRKFVPEEKLLIVDDIHDKGITLKEVEAFIKKIMPNNKYRIATLYYKPTENKKSVPDYYAEMTMSWISFPWETE